MATSVRLLYHVIFLDYKRTRRLTGFPQLSLISQLGLY